MIAVEEMTETEYIDSVRKVLDKYYSAIYLLVAKAATRANQRKVFGFKSIALVGPGRSGKDEIGKIISEISYLNYSGSISYAIRPYVAEALGMPVDQCYNDRHNHRVFWYNWCNELRRQLPSASWPSRLCLAEGDFTIGIRAKPELDASMSEGVIDRLVWVDRPDVAEDPTMDYTKEQALAYPDSLVLTNDGDLDDLRKKVYSLAKPLCLPLRANY